MENRCPNYRAYDGDYNDMLCLIESNPVAIEPAEPVTPPVDRIANEQERIPLVRR